MGTKMELQKIKKGDKKMKERIENKLKELEKRFKRRVENANLSIDVHARAFWYMKANETLDQIKLLKELIEE
jgi:hypothetical protein